jgi:hypothetical protein
LFAGRRIPANDRLGGTVEQRLFTLKTCFEVGCPPAESLTANSGAIGGLSGYRQERQSACAQPEGWAEVR